MKTNLRERLTRYRCFIRPKVRCSSEFYFKSLQACFPRKTSQPFIWGQDTTQQKHPKLNIQSAQLHISNGKVDPNKA